MQDKNNYIPSKCSMSQCAFPNQVCSRCLANVSVRGKLAFWKRNPKENYEFCFKFSRLNH